MGHLLSEENLAHFRIHRKRRGIGNGNIVQTTSGIMSRSSSIKSGYGLASRLNKWSRDLRQQIIT
ncbi:MAG: hypothetical protein J0M28_10085 [Thauera sp.]|nr:hypothetical protein [Thauera sp.]